MPIANQYITYRSSTSLTVADVFREHWAEYRRKHRVSPQQAKELLRRLVRRAVGKHPDPSLAILDSQTVKATEAGANGALTGAKGSRAANAISWWTVSGCYWFWLFTPPIFKIMMALVGSYHKLRPNRAVYKRSLPMASILKMGWSSGSNSSSRSSWKSSLDL